MTLIYGSLPKRPTPRAIVKAANIDGCHRIPSEMIAFVSEHFAGRKTVSKREGQEIMAALIGAVCDGAFDGPEKKKVRPTPWGYSYEKDELPEWRQAAPPPWPEPLPEPEEKLSYGECLALLAEAVEGMTPADEDLFRTRFVEFTDSPTCHAGTMERLATEEVFEEWIDAQFDLWHAGEGGFDGPAPKAVEVEVEYEYDADDEPALIAACLPEIARLPLPTVRKETQAALNLRRAYYGYDRLTRRHLACLATQGDALAFDWLVASRPPSSPRRADRL